MNKILFTVLGISLVFIFTGCSKRLDYINTNKVLKTEHIIKKSYEIGKIKTSYVGNSMIEVFDYNEILIGSNIMKPTKDFIFNSDSSRQFRFMKDDEFKILGTWTIDEKSFVVVNNKKMEALCLLINVDGSIYNKIINKIPNGPAKGEYLTVAYKYEHEPRSVRLKTVVKDVKTEINKGTINYQLIYTGSDDTSFFITYREFTKDNIARPSFFQNLTYSKKNKQIRFKDLIIRIKSVDNEKIVFTVIDDNKKQ